MTGHTRCSSGTAKLADELEAYAARYSSDWSSACPTVSWADLDLIVTALRGEASDDEIRELNEEVERVRGEAAGEPDPFNRKQVETVCRAVCEVEGVDPDEGRSNDNCDPRWTFYADAVAAALSSGVAQAERRPVGWFQYNDYHGWQQVAKEFEGGEGLTPLYALSSTSRACTCGADIALDYHQDWCPAFPSTQTLPPDWKQDQVETSRPAPKVTSTTRDTP